jgi:hypothetical protein
MLHFASQVIVQKQQMYLGAKRTPPGKSGRALQLPRACAGCGCFTTCTRHGGNSSKRLLKDRPTQADPQIPNQTTAVGLLWPYTTIIQTTGQLPPKSPTHTRSLPSLPTCPVHSAQAVYFTTHACDPATPPPTQPSPHNCALTAPHIFPKPPGASQ